MLKPLLLRLHRWVALAFALPLALVILTGLFLALEPALKATTPAGTVTLARLEAVVQAAGAKAEGGIAVRGYDGTATVGGRQGITLSLADATPREPGWLAGAFRTARGLHERLLLDLDWLVTASTIAMLLLAPLGLLLGWPRLRHSLGGWHRLVGWVLLPLLVGSPLTGLALAFGITFTPPLQRDGRPPREAAPPALMETLRQVAARHSLDGLDFVRQRGGSQLVRVLDSSGTATTYRVTGAGLEPLPRNWPRLLHEGNWGGLLGSLANAVAGLGMAGLLVTGVLIWARRKLRRRQMRAARLAGAAALPG